MRRLAILVSSHSGKGLKSLLRYEDLTYKSAYHRLNPVRPQVLPAPCPASQPRKAIAIALLNCGLKPCALFSNMRGVNISILVQKGCGQTQWSEHVGTWA